MPSGLSFYRRIPLFQSVLRRRDAAAAAEPEDIAGEYYRGRIERFQQWQPGRLSEPGPHEALAPGVVLGFEGSAEVQVRVEKPPDGGGLTIHVDDVGRSRWLTIETELRESALKALGGLAWRMVAAATPRARCRAMLRLWPAPGQFEDIHLDTQVLRPGRSVIELASWPDPNRLTQLSGAQSPRVLLFLPLQEARYDIDTIAFYPV